MAEPPRLSEITLPEEKSIIYFVTLCVKDRLKVLANAKTFDAIRIAIQQLRRWNVLQLSLCQTMPISLLDRGRSADFRSVILRQVSNDYFANRWTVRVGN